MIAIVAGWTCPQCGSDGPHFMDKEDRLDVSQFGSDMYTELISREFECKACGNTWDETEVYERPYRTGS